MTPKALIAATLSLSASAVAAQDVSNFRIEPLYEVRLGTIGVYGPDFPGAEESSFNWLPFPYVVYRGDMFSLGDEGAEFIPVATPRYELGISGGGAFAADSDSNAAREGMPDLDFLFELGPEIEINGPTFADGLGTVKLFLQGRAVFATDWTSVDYVGWIIEPELKVERRGLRNGRLKLDATLAPQYGDQGLNDYFYQVDPEFARAGRPAYDAERGYMGTEVRAGFSYDLTNRVNVFGRAGLEVRYGAVNRDSPLFERPLAGSVGLGLSVALYKSEREVRVRP